MWQWNRIPANERNSLQFSTFILCQPRKKVHEKILHSIVVAKLCSMHIVQNKQFTLMWQLNSWQDSFSVSRLSHLYLELGFPRDGTTRCPFVPAGNALEWVQRVHAPADLRDITFCTRRILTDFIKSLKDSVSFDLKSCNIKKVRKP